MRQRLALAGASFVAIAALGCRADPAESAPPKRDCGLTIWYRPASASARVEVVSSLRNWARPGDLMVDSGRADGYRALHLDAPAGEVTYALVDDGTWLADPNVGTTAIHDDREVTWTAVASCGAPAFDPANVTADPGGSATVATIFRASGAGDAIDSHSITLTARDGSAQPFAATKVDPKTGAIAITLAGLAKGKHTFALAAHDVAGRATSPKTVSVWVEDTPFDRRDSLIYQVIVDRFRGDNGPLEAPASPSGRAGGTLRGLTSAVDAGDFDALGVTTIWVAPLYANPDGEFPGNDGRAYSSYHGYWPIASRAIEPKLGTEADVDAFVATAHRHGIRVLFDVVPNHVHEQHPYVRDEMSAGWFNRATPTCVCGVGSCDWATHIQTCWFASYLPDFDWTSLDVARQVSADVGFWIDRFDGDGVRIDAVPMMPRLATRRIVAALRDGFQHPGNPLFLLGENYTGPGAYDLLKYQLGPFGLDSEFHFPLMWTLRSAVASRSLAMRDIAQTIADGERAWQGSGATMTTMIGNHDVSRFASESAGTASGDTWDPAPQSDDPLVYEKQMFALGIVYTAPGAPVLYYGDEIALAGKADPDSRRAMPAETALSTLQKATRAFVQKLGRTRKCVNALRRGNYRELYSDDETFVFAREISATDLAVIIATRAPSTPPATPLPGIPSGDYVDLLSGAPTTLTPELTKLDSAPFSVRILVPRASACVATLVPPASAAP